MKLKILYGELLGALLRNDFTFLAETIHECPKNANTEVTLTFLQSKDSYFAMVSMDSMAMAYLFGNNYDYAEVFARICFDIGIQFYNSGGVDGHEDLNYYVGNSFYYLLKIFLDTGRYTEGIELYNEVSGQYPTLLTEEKFIGAHLEASEIYLVSNNVEKARQILDFLNPAQIPPASLIQYDRLRNNIGQLTSKVTNLPEDAKQQKNQIENESRLNMLSVLDYFLKELPASSEEDNNINKLAEQWRSSLEKDSGQDNFEQSTKIFEEILTYFKGISSNESENHLNELRYRLQQTQKIYFDDVNGFSKPHLQKAVLVFNELLKEFEKNNYQGDIDNTLWSIYICYKRMEQYEAASEKLEKLHARLELTRNRLTNINERAGVFNRFPHFFAALAEMHYRNGNPQGLFQTIEASKGRNLADKMLSKTGKETSIINTANLFVQLTEVLNLHTFHYLSLFTDEDWSYSLLVTSNGKIVASHVPIDHTQLEKWVQKDYPDPKSWLTPKSGVFGKKVDLSSILTPFLKPVEVALNDKLITTGDHIAYSPDGFMHLFPLHYVKQIVEDISLKILLYPNCMVQGS